MTRPGRFPSRLLKKPHGVGAPLNVYMFTPRRLLAHARTLYSQPTYFVKRLCVLYHQIQEPEAPWLTAEAVRFLARIIRPDMLGFEWGSGKSTVWLGRRLKFLVSIEHDPEWYGIVRGMLAAERLTNVDLRHVPRTLGPAEYAGQILGFADGFFDIALIDGDARDACIAAVGPKLKRGGWAIVDNADNDYDVASLAGYECTATSNGVWRTDIYRRV